MIALVLVTALVPYLRWRTTHYVLTTHRLMTRLGILNHTGRDIPLNRINNAMYEQSFFERIVNSGTLVVESAGEDGQQVFRNIPDADETQQLINRLVEGDHDRRTRNAARYEAQYEARYDADYRDGVPVDDPDQPTRRMERPVTRVSPGLADDGAAHGRLLPVRAAAVRTRAGDPAPGPGLARRRGRADREPLLGAGRVPVRPDPRFAELGIAGIAYDEVPGRPPSALLSGFLSLELSHCRPVVRHVLRRALAGWRWAASPAAAAPSSGPAGCRRWAGWRRSARSR